MRNDALSGRLAVLLGCFAVLFPYLIYPMDQTYYYANSKVYYLIGFAGLLWTIRWFGSEHAHLSLSRVKPAEWLLFLWLLLAGFSTFKAVSISLIGYHTEHHGVLVLLSYLILYAASSRWISRTSQLRIVRWIVLCSPLPGLYGIAQHFGIRLLPQDRLPEAHLPRYRFEQRSWSFFDNPDYFGAYLVLLFILALTCFLAERKRMMVTLYAIVLAILGTALLLSSTRSAWVGTGAGVLVLVIALVWSRKNKLQWKRWAFLAAAGCLLFTVFNLASDNDYASRAATIPADIKKLFAQSDSGTAGASRWYIWQSTAPLIQDSFWLGSGPNTFRHLFHPRIAEDFTAYISHPVYDANNEYLQIALTMGVPALAAYLLFLATVLHGGIRAAQQADGERQLFLWGLLAAVIGYCVQALFNISAVSVAPYFWIALGFIAAHSRRAEHPKEIKTEGWR